MSSPPPLFTTSPLRNLSFPAYSPAHPKPLQSHAQSASFLSTHNYHGHDTHVFDEYEESHSAMPNMQLVTPTLPPSPVFETLTFAKIPVPSSTTVSTDSEAVSSDWGMEGNASASGSRSGAQSPSLITCLFQSQSISARPSRQFSSASTSPHPTPTTPTTPRRVHASKPILRRMTTSTSASEDCREHYPYAPASQGFGLGLTKALNQTDRPPVPPAGTAPEQLKKRPSALTFAVTAVQPRPPPSRSTSRSTSVSPLSSYAGAAQVRGRMSPPLRIPSWATECDEEEEFVNSPLPIPGHESDSDEGYREDSEGGFTSEEEDQQDKAVTKLRQRPSWASTTWARNFGRERERERDRDRRAATDDAAPSGFASTMEGVDPLAKSSTIDTVMMRGRKTSICIVNSKPSSSRCSRHRSPPPPSPSNSPAPAPPAAASPSAADLCRRRGSLATGAVAGNTRSAGPSRAPSTSAARGWRSDDAAFLPTRRSTVSTAFILPSATSASTTCRQYNQHQHQHPHQPQQLATHALGGRKGSLPTPNLGTPMRCRSILRRQPPPPPASIPMQRSSGTIVPAPQLPTPLEQTAPYAGVVAHSYAPAIRRGSAPPTSSGLGENEKDASYDALAAPAPVAVPGALARKDKSNSNSMFRASSAIATFAVPEGRRGCVGTNDGHGLDRYPGGGSGGVRAA